MKKIPSALKWLAEKRARVAGEIESCIQVKETLVCDVDALRLKLGTTETLLAAATSKYARLTEELAALDKTIVIFDSAITPGNIVPIHGWRGSYGKRGQLRQFLIETLKSRAPEFVLTTELALWVTLKFSMAFESEEARRVWYNGSLRGALKVLVNQGFVERNEHSEVSSGAPMGWRWKETVQLTLADLGSRAR